MRITELRPKEVSHVDRGANRRPYFLLKSEGVDKELNLDDVTSLIKSGAVEPGDVEQFIQKFELSEETAEKLRKAAAADATPSKEDGSMPKVDVTSITKDGKVDPDLVREEFQPLAKQLADIELDIVDGEVDLEKVDEQHRAALQGLAAAHIEKKNKNEGENPVDLEQLRKEDGSIDMDRVPESMRPIAEAMNKQAEQIRKSEEALAEERRIRLRKEYRDQAASEYADVAGHEELGDFLLKCEGQLDEETFTQLKKLLGAAQERIEKSALFSESGTSLGGGGTSGDKIEKAAEAIMSDEPKLSKEQAIAKAIERNPELYKEYMADRAN